MLFRSEFNNWDNFTIHLPFGSGLVVWGEPILVNFDATKEEMETKRNLLEQKLLKAHKDSKEEVDNK